MKYLQVMISSELRTQALCLLDHLTRKRLIFGGPVFSGPARFLWKNEVVERLLLDHHVHARGLAGRVDPAGGRGVCRGGLHDHIHAV